MAASPRCGALWSKSFADHVPHPAPTILARCAAQLRHFGVSELRPLRRLVVLAEQMRTEPPRTAQRGAPESVQAVRHPALEDRPASPVSALSDGESERPRGAASFSESERPAGSIGEDSEVGRSARGHAETVRELTVLDAEVEAADQEFRDAEREQASMLELLAVAFADDQESIPTGALKRSPARRRDSWNNPLGRPPAGGIFQPAWTPNPLEPARRFSLTGHLVAFSNPHGPPIRSSPLDDRDVLAFGDTHGH